MNAISGILMARKRDSSPMPQQPETSEASTPLARALDQNETVKDVVEQSAAELVVINAVLKQEIPDHIQVDEVAQALLKTDELETRITETAQDLAEVNEVLAQEIDQRADLERELAVTKAQLEEARNKS
ncbi:MAG: hypothetical protein V4454_00940 [Pseudomonadota bacterium]